MNALLARTALLAAGADLAVKLMPAGPPRVLLPGLLEIRYAFNHGMAFSFLTHSPALSLALSIIAVLIFGIWCRLETHGRAESLGAGLLLGGALGNLLDRLLHGGVSDYLRLMFINFPVFNLADICVTLGALVLMALVLKPERGQGHA